ncbi:hypothetical protein PITCH_A350036 [uncultured Desulfobacterium sp.]|uniref:Uncharacterized protein n=1 Tax=uncultured Desulfobacterium sp. TaxID=201089 RepID=A0A445MZB0_9BACT|nr:hypothetical protein PITCH_A350036 [uncultured Desulfobacterium sp.]
MPLKSMAREVKIVVTIAGMPMALASLKESLADNSLGRLRN